MVKSLTIGLVDDGVATWNPVSDGNLLVTGGAGCGKTWWLTHTLIPGLNEMGQRVYMFDGYVDRGYTKPVQGVIPVNDPTSILEEPDSFLIIDHVNPGLEDDSALMETVRESDARIPIILSVQLVPDREQWSAWAELDIMVPSLRPSAVPHTTASRSVVRSPQNRRSNCNSSTTRKDIPVKDEKLEAVAKEVFLSIPPDVRTGVFIDVFTPCDWHHAAQCMVDYAGILDDPREPFNLVCDMPVICTTAVTEKTVVSDVRPLVGLPDDAYDDIVAGEMDYVGVRSGTDGPVYVGQLPGSVEQAYDEYLDTMTDIMSGSWRAVPQDALEAAQWLAYRLSELTQRHLVLERSRTWKLAE